MNEAFAFSKFPNCCVFLAPNCWINELICLWFVRKRFLSLAFMYNAFQKVDVKQFVKSLQCHHTKPDASFCGKSPVLCGPWLCWLLVNEGCVWIKSNFQPFSNSRYFLFFLDPWPSAYCLCRNCSEWWLLVDYAPIFHSWNEADWYLYQPALQIARAFRWCKLALICGECP